MTDFFAITALILLIISGLFGWIISEKWHILSNEERISYLYVTFGGAFMSGLSWVIFIILLVKK
jgi:hypothetical protein